MKKLKKFIDDFDKDCIVDAGDNGVRMDPSPTGIKFLDDRYEEMRNPERIVHPYYRFFFQLSKKYKFNTIVELGSWQGTSAAHFAAGNSKSLVITIDHHSDHGDEDNINKTIQAACMFSNLRYIRGWTCEAIWKQERDKHYTDSPCAYPRMKELIYNRGIDLLFIDSWHRYDQAKRDWDAYRPLLNDGALVICDDIDKGSIGGGIEDMHTFWEEMPKPKFLDSRLHGGIDIGFLFHKK